MYRETGLNVGNPEVTFSSKDPRNALTPRDMYHFSILAAHNEERRRLTGILSEHLKYEERREYAITYLTERGKI